MREVHHVALLIGYGVGAVNPYLAMETVEDLVDRGYITGVTAEQAVKNLIKALGKGVLKIMSKMGISTIASYRGAQVFEAIGLSRDLVNRHFAGTPSQIDGVGLDVIAREVAAAPRRRLPGLGTASGAPQAQLGRRISVAPRRRGAPVRPRDGLQAPALDPHAPVRRVQRVRRARQQPVEAADDVARPVRVRVRSRAHSDRRGGAHARHRQALHHGRDVVRLHLAGGARDARDRDEQAGRQVEHGRGRRVARAALRPDSGAARSSRWHPGVSA